MGPRIQYASLYIAFIGAAYLLNFTRVALLLLILQYTVEAVFHACRLLSYSEKGEIARPLYHLHEVLFVLARLASITLAVLTFWYGLALLPTEQQVIDIGNGIFNTALFRLNALIAIGLLQGMLQEHLIDYIIFYSPQLPIYIDCITYILYIDSLVNVELHQLPYSKNERKCSNQRLQRSCQFWRKEKETGATTSRGKKEKEGS